MDFGNRNRRRTASKASRQHQYLGQERVGHGPGAVLPDTPQSEGPFGPVVGAFRHRRGNINPIEIGRIVDQVVLALHTKDDDAVRRCCYMLAEEPAAAGRQALDTTLLVFFQRALSAVWQRGWQPTDLVRLARRRYGPAHARIMVDMIAAEMRGYAAVTVDERWKAQLRQLEAKVWWSSDVGFVSALAERGGLAKPELLRQVLETLHLIGRCPKVARLCPPPGQARHNPSKQTDDASQQVHERQLSRVRALLAKAESTDFPEEAESLTSKAQELMTRHSIDHAMLAAGADTPEQPVGRRVGVDNPYEAPKVLLLDAVARANRCRSIWTTDLGFVTVLGFGPDVDAVELLFTSLLVQATTAMVRHGSRRDSSGRSTTRAFRRSFLTAYAQRIRQRLAEATRHATQQAGVDLEGGPEADLLLPVLASRDEAVSEMADDLFPELVGQRLSVTNREGYISGVAAADNADLGFRAELPKRKSSG